MFPEPNDCFLFLPGDLEKLSFEGDIPSNIFSLWVVCSSFSSFCGPQGPLSVTLRLPKGYPDVEHLLNKRNISLDWLSICIMVLRNHEPLHPGPWGELQARGLFTFVAVIVIALQLSVFLVNTPRASLKEKCIFKDGEFIISVTANCAINACASIWTCWSDMWCELVWDILSSGAVRSCHAVA